MTSQSKSKKDKRYDYVIEAPDGGYGWVVLCACFFISFIVDGSMYSIGFILPHIRKNFDATQDKANLINGLYTGFLFCSGPIVSGLSKQFGIRAVVMGGAFVTACTFVISAFASSIYFIMVFYGIIGGISTGCTYIASLIVIADYFDKKKGMATGITMAGSGVGSFLFAPLVEFLIQRYDWKFTIILVSCIMIQCCVLGAFLRPIPPTKRLKAQFTKGEIEKMYTKDVAAFTGSAFSIRSMISEEDEPSGCCDIAVNIVKEMFNIKLLFQNRNFLFAVLSQFFVFIGYFLPYIYVPLRVEELGLKEAALVMGIIGIVNIPSRMLFGILADRRYLSPINLNTLTCALTATSLLIYYLFTTLALQILFAVLFAVGLGAMNCLCTPYLTDIVGRDKFSNAMGILNLFRGVACFIGQPLGGFISDKTAITGAFFFSGAMFSIGFLFTGLVSFSTLIGKCCGKKDNQENEEAINETELKPLGQN